MRNNLPRLFLILSLFLACFAQSKASASNPDLLLKINADTKFPAIFPVKEESGSNNDFLIFPELPNESYLFTPVPQISFKKSHPLQAADFKYNAVYAGKKHHYYQTAQRIFMASFEDNNMNFVNFVDISVPDILFHEQSCTHIAFDSRELYSISACKDLSDGTTYLVMIAYLSSRPSYVQSLKTSISETVQMKLVGQTLYVLEHDPTTNTNNKLHVYKINLGSGKPAQQAMEILGYIDSTPFQASNLDITSFDVAGTDRKYAVEIQKIFIAENGYGLRTIDLNCETGVLSNAFSNDEFYGTMGVAIKSCDCLNSCDFVITNQGNTVTYAKWTQNGDKTIFSYYRSLSAPLEKSLLSKITINKDFLIILSQKDSNQNSVLIYSLVNQGNDGFVNHLGAIDYEPMTLNGNDFSFECLTEDVCRVIVPNPVDHVEEFTVRNHFSISVQNDNFKSSYLTIVPKNIAPGASIVRKTVTLVKGEAEDITEDTQDDNFIGRVALAEVAIAELLHKRMTPFMMYSNATRVAESSKKISADSDGGDNTSDTTVHGWFIIFLIIVAGLAGIAYYTVKGDEKEARARSTVNNQQRSQVEGGSQHDYKLMSDEQPLNGTLSSGRVNVEENGKGAENA